MNGSIQLVVNLRHRSVQYISENDELNRYSNVLKGDVALVEDLLKEEDAYAGETEDKKIHRVIRSVRDMVTQVGNLSYFTIVRNGCQVAIHPDDISYVTIDATGDLAEIE